MSRFHKLCDNEDGLVGPKFLLHVKVVWQKTIVKAWNLVLGWTFRPFKTRALYCTATSATNHQMTRHHTKWRGTIPSDAAPHQVTWHHTKWRGATPSEEAPHQVTPRHISDERTNKYKLLHVSATRCHHQGVIWTKQYKTSTLMFVLCRLR